MSRIQQLPIIVANQIAAGEVIERPASVVKELLENALDAQATAIHVDIGYGGLNQVKVSDNGIGILAEDLPLAIAAHATSKIKQLSDLYAIASMGFRGEALASIASVSRLTISSKPASQEHAMTLVSDGHSLQATLCARSQGTTVDVRDIFFNMPVRKKFLKTERSEFQAIEMLIKRFALSTPTIAISVTHNGKPQLSLPAAHCDKTRLQRIRKLLGKNFVEQSIYLDIEHAGMRLHGWISNSNYQSSQSDKQWIYVNARMVKDKLLNHAIKKAYESFLDPGRHPLCLLYLTINPMEVDVNVHPTKHEIRFQQPRLVHDFITSQIQHALAVPKIDASRSFIGEVVKGKRIHETYLPSPLLPRSMRPLSKLAEESEVRGEAQRRTGVYRSVHEDSSSASTKQFASSVEFGKRSIEQNTRTNSWIILNSAYALIFMCEQPYLVDLVKLQCHWLLSLLMQQSLPLTSRPLLVPVSYSCRPLELNKLNNWQQLLCQVGMEVNLAGENAILVRSLPIAVPHLDIKAFLTTVFKSIPSTREQLLEQLCLCQALSIDHILPEERDMLGAYLQKLHQKGELPSWCKQLSITFCENLLNA